MPANTQQHVSPDAGHSDAPCISIVVPCHNEADNIEALVDEIVATVEPLARFEILVIDDGSEDDTRARLLAARQRLGKRLRIIVHAKNKGQSAAICTGVDKAHGALIATLDGDGQNDPADIETLLTALADAGPSPRPIVCGHRRARQDNWIRKLSSRVANRVRESLLHDDTPDTGCGLKLFYRSAFLRLPRFDHMHRFLPALVQRDGGYVISVPVRHRPRRAGRSKYGIHNRLWAGIIDLAGVMWLRRRRFHLTHDEEL